ncbi:MAG TPA: hypothetical protein VGG33_24780, partial [Polyangia bacterium]
MKIARWLSCLLALACTATCASPRDVAIDPRDGGGDTSGRGGAGGASAGTGGTGAGTGGTGATDTAAPLDVPAADVAPGADVASDGRSGCEANETRCSGTAVEICDTAGIWTKKTDCPGVCQAGACTGSCRPETKRCGADQ